MTEKTKGEDFRLAYDNIRNPRYMQIEVPIGKYVDDEKDGMALFMGKMEEAKAIGIRIISQEIVKKRTGNVLIKPRGPVSPSVA